MWKKNNDGQSLPCVGKVASGASRIGFWRDEKERGRSSQAGDIRAPEHRCAVPFPQWGRQRGGGFTAPKGSQPRLATLGSPFQGKGLAWTLPPLEGGAPKGRRLDGESGIKKIGGDRLKCVVYESTLSTAARSPFPNGEGYDTRMPFFSHCQSEYTHMWKKE